MRLAQNDGKGVILRASTLGPARLRPSAVNMAEVSRRPALDTTRLFQYYRNMDAKQVVAALGALAQESRLKVFRLLVQRGPEGLPAGAISERVSVPPTTLSFHLTQLTHAGLITARREGRSIVYAADYGGMQRLMAFFTENCCQDAGCAPTGAQLGKVRRRR
jgi:ArsR family transcriptional regulator